MKQAKNYRVDFRCTEEEFCAIDDTAKSSGLSKSDYVRKVVLGFRPWKKLTDEELQLLQDVRAATADLQKLHNYFYRGEYATLMAKLAPIIINLKDLIYDRDRKKH